MGDEIKIIVSARCLYEHLLKCRLLDFVSLNSELHLAFTDQGIMIDTTAGWFNHYERQDHGNRSVVVEVSRLHRLKTLLGVLPDQPVTIRFGNISGWIGISSIEV